MQAKALKILLGLGVLVLLGGALLMIAAPFILSGA